MPGNKNEELRADFEESSSEDERVVEEEPKSPYKMNQMSKKVSMKILR